MEVVDAVESGGVVIAKLRGLGETELTGEGILYLK